eukprot:11819790-Heterocapsa_arctica.AAC.1
MCIRDSLWEYHLPHLDRGRATTPQPSGLYLPDWPRGTREGRVNEGCATQIPPQRDDDRRDFRGPRGVRGQVRRPP